LKRINKLLSSYFENFAWFYQYLRYRVILLIGLNVLLGILDGFGLAMFLPLLQMADENGNQNAETLGNLKFLVEGMRSMGISISIASILGFLCFFFTLKGLTKYACDSYIVSIQQLFIRKIRLRLLDGLNTISFKSFMRADAGRIQNTMSGEVERVSRSFLSYFTALQQIVLVIVYMGFAFYVDAGFALLVGVGGVLTNFSYKKINSSTKKASALLTKDANNFQGLIMQHVGNYKYLKATGLISFFGARLKENVLLLEKSNRRIGVLSAIITGAREPLLIYVVAAVILVQVKLLGASLGPILISLLFFYRALTALLLMQSSWNYFLAATGSIGNMKGLQKELDNDNEQDGTVWTKQFAREITLQQVSLSFGDKTVLRDVNLVVRKNETLAFAGESGSGKTSLVNILTGLIPPDKGIMTVDNISRDRLNTASFQQRIGYITQDPVIFNDTIFNNITLWAEPTPHNISRYKNAIEKASIAEFINGLLQNDNTVLGNNGINLSGGQKQRISIARELYKEIDILVMDEATSALDSETEKLIQDNIDALKGQYTILIVAHRLSTIKNADRIVLLSNGQIEHIGTYQQLTESAPMFKRMVALQEL